MQQSGLVNNWSRKHTSGRQQAQVLCYLLERVEYFESINFEVAMDRLFDECVSECKVSKSTARRFWIHFEKYGEIPIETEKYMSRLKTKFNWLPKSARITADELSQLKAIVDRRPDLFLDEISVVFGIQTGKFLHHVTLWRYISNNLGYSLQSLTECASQQCEQTRDEYKYVLDLVLHEDPERLIMVDETHRDRNASRRRRGYGKRNAGGLRMRRWFKSEVRYTMIGVADVNGFIESACGIYKRDEISDEGAAGTVTRDIFEDWVEKMLCPVLGDYSKGEKRSVVLLDNASTHMSQKVVDLIEATNAKILYSTPFSPDLNPIENYFSVYKRYLKRNSEEMRLDYEKVHLGALGTVNREMGIKYFRRCGIPGANKMMTMDERKKYNNDMMIIIVVILVANGIIRL